MPSGAIEALAAKSLSIAKIHTNDLETLKHTEEQLDKVIDRESKAPPKQTIPKIRFHGERFLHSKQVLLLVVALNVIDCLLVMGELIFDIFYIVRVLYGFHDRDDKFMNVMVTSYPTELQDVDDMPALFSQLVQSNIQWKTNDTSNVHGLLSLDKIRTKRETADPNNVTVISFDTYNGGSVEDDIAHGFHKASITILGILVLENIFKIFCLGKHMLEHKLEIFDSVIVFSSFVLDLVFIKGITIYKIEEFVIILAFLVPWRILRVVNSLVIAIIDHEHFRMKLLYIQKKHISNQAKALKAELKLYEQTVRALETFCKSRGIPEEKFRIHIGDLKNRKKNFFTSSSSLQITSLAFDNPIASEDTKF